jgi:hypothetical protein
LVRLSKDLKRLRAILRDPNRAALCAVSILTEMSFAETMDLAAACGRLESPVQGLFLNMARPESPDPLCDAFFRREFAVRDRFTLAFPGIRQTVVYWQSDPRGIENLEALGQLLYQSADKDGFAKSRHSSPRQGPSRADSGGNPESVRTIEKAGFPRIKACPGLDPGYGAGLIKPGMTESKVSSA